MRTNVFMIMAMAFMLWGHSQTDNEIRFTVKTLTFLNTKASLDNDADALLLYQNVWQDIKKRYTRLRSDTIFKLANQYFNEVAKLNSSNLGTICFSIKGQALCDELSIPEDSDVVVVYVGGVTEHMYIPDDLSAYDIGKVKGADLEYAIAVREASTSEQTATLPQDKIDLIQEYQGKLEQMVYKDEKTGKYSNIFGYQSGRAKDVKKANVRNAEFHKLYLDKKRRRELEKLFKSKRRQRSAEPAARD